MRQLKCSEGGNGYLAKSNRHWTNLNRNNSKVENKAETLASTHGISWTGDKESSHENATCPSCAMGKNIYTYTW